MKVGDLVRHVGFGDLLGIVTEIDSRYRDKRFMVLWTRDQGYGLHCIHHPRRLEVVRESR